MKEAFDLIKERLEEKKGEHLHDEKVMQGLGKNNLASFCSAKAMALDGAIQIVSEVEAEYGNGWIPCDSERMPEDGVNVLVWFEYYRYGRYNRLYQTHGISYTYEGKWSGFVNGESGWQQLRIIAWMPLPAPYKPEKGAQDGR